MMNKIRRKQNNQGFTLVEVLVAMTILAVIVVPLLHAFVTAAFTNSKAKKVLRATTAAQNTIEDLKAVSVEDLARSVYGYSVDENGKTISRFPVSSFTSSVDGNTYSAYEADVTGSSWTKTSDASVTATTVSGAVTSTVFSAAPDKTLSYVLPNVTLESAAYDLILTLEPNIKAQSVSINSMQQSDCVYFAQSSTQASTEAAAFNTDNLTYVSAHTDAPSVTTETFMEKMTRTITVTLTPTTGGPVSVDLEYAYDCSAASTGQATAVQVITENESAVSDNGLSAVYVYYYPLYGNASVRDEFVVNNEKNVDCDVYFIAMEGADYNSFNEAQYRAKLTVYEEYKSSEYTGSNARTSMHTGILSNVDKTQWTAASGNYCPVSPEIRTLGNTEERVYEYKAVVTVYMHNENSFTKTGGKETFTPDEDDRITEFDGSLIK